MKTKIINITVLYDGQCEFCRQCVKWLKGQNSFFPIKFLASQTGQAREQFPELINEFKAGRFIVVTSNREVYFDSKGKLFCLYSLIDYRNLSLILGSPKFFKYTNTAFNYIAEKRYNISSVLLYLNRIAK